jgi:flagellar hook-associated protein 1 FlgK
MSDLMRIALSGLVANQAAMNTTGHNIAGAGVEGFSRQRVELGIQPPQYFPGGFIGRGVDVENIQRTVDDFITRQLRTDTWVYNAAESFTFYAEQINGVLSDPSVGLTGRIDRFFSAFQTAAGDPTWIPSRQVLIGEAKALSEGFNNLHDRLGQLNSAVNTQLDSFAADIDSLAKNIAELNVKIQAVSGAGGGRSPNDLLDQRDQRLLELAAIVDISTVSDGASVNILLGKGQALVVGGVANRVSTVNGRFDPSRRDLAVSVNGQARIVSDEATGGKAGGLLDFRTRVLDQAFNQIGRVAIGISEQINAQHALGMDLEGELGGLFFSDQNNGIAPGLRARPAGDNAPASNGVITVNIDDISALSTSSYQLDVLSGGSWRLYRNLDQTVVASGAALSSTLVSVDGFTLDLNLPAGNFLPGDSYLIEPTRSGARDISTNITRPEDVALAQPVSVVSDTGNLGQGKIQAGNVFDTSLPLFTTTPGQLAPPLLIRFTDADSFDVLNNSNPASPVALVPPLTGLSFTPGVINTLFSTNPADPDYFGFQLTINGNPSAGDAFAIGYNPGKSDNRNAVALGKLQIADILANSSATFQSAYGQLVGFVGTETRQSRVDSDAGKVVVAQTKAARDEVSGVNLDEEATNLVRYQQAYNATAQVIAVARSLIDTLLKATS